MNEFLTLIGTVVIQIFGVLIVLCTLTWLMYTKKKIPNIVRICLAIFVTFSMYIIMGKIVNRRYLMKDIALGIFVIALVSINIGIGFMVINNKKDDDKHGEK